MATSHCSALTGNQILKACGPGLETGEIRPKMFYALEGAEPLMPQRTTAPAGGMQLVPVVGMLRSRTKFTGGRKLYLKAPGR